MVPGRLFLMLCSILLIGWLKGQSQSQLVDTLNQISDEKFEGGQSQFYALLNSVISYPRSSLSNAIIGTSVVAFKVSAKGSIINISILTTLDEEIDSEIVRAINSTSDFWLVSEDQKDLVFLIPVTFVAGGVTFTRNLIPDQLCPEIKIMAITGNNNKFKEDEFYSQKYTKEFNKGNLSKALPHLDELIRRNPFDAQLFQNRIRLRMLLGSPELACRDIQYLTRILKQKARDAVPCN